MSEAEAAQDATSTTTTGDRAQEMLIEFLRDHDAGCPACGYSLRALTRPVCPECRQELVLTVGTRRLLLGWLFAAVAPGFFSGIAACFLSIPTVGMYVEDGTLMTPFVGAVLFGWSSGIFAIMLARKRNRFIAQSRARQRWLVLAIWLTHFMALVLFILFLAPHI
ncbi:MAG: hypothetical protein ACYTJ0_11680 [Planctomycetota bacterium]|jgi:hypothetical protein